MITTIIFDIGSVLVSWHYKAFLRRLFEDEKTCKVVAKCIFENPNYIEFDKGMVTKEQFLDNCISHCPYYSKEITYAFSRIGECVKQYSFAHSWIEEYKKRGYRVLFLSNYSDYVRGANMKALDFVKKFDGGLFSCDIKMVKPYAPIYYKMIEDFNLIPEECLFIDDKRSNLRVAEELGIKCVWYQNYKDAKMEVEKILSGNYRYGNFM